MLEGLTCPGEVLPRRFEAFRPEPGRIELQHGMMDSSLETIPLTIGSRLGPYEILSAIGEGGMGQRVRDTRLGRTVAIKILTRRWRWTLRLGGGSRTKRGRCRASRTPTSASSTTSTSMI